MELEINQTFQIINDKSCREYYVKIPKENCNIIEEYHYKQPTKEDKEKYFNYIIEKIPEDEKIITKHSDVNIDDVYFRVFTKKKFLLLLEDKIYELLESTNKEWTWEKYHMIDIDENMWCRLSLMYFDYDKESISKIVDLLDAEDFEVIINGHMEMDFLYCKLRTTKDYTHKQRVDYLYKKWERMGSLLSEIRNLGVTKDSCIYKSLEKVRGYYWEKYSRAYDANEKIYMYLPI